MLKELKGTWIELESKQTRVWSGEPRVCPGCKRMTCVFVNKEGRTVCTECAERKA